MAIKSVDPLWYDWKTFPECFYDDYNNAVIIIGTQSQEFSAYIKKIMFVGMKLPTKIIIGHKSPSTTILTDFNSTCGESR